MVLKKFIHNNNLNERHALELYELFTVNIFNRETLLCEIIDNVLARRWGLSTIDKPYNDTPHNTQKEIAADRGRMYNRMKKAQGGRDGRTFGEDKMSSPKTAELIAQQTRDNM